MLAVIWPKLQACFIFQVTSRAAQFRLLIVHFRSQNVLWRIVFLIIQSFAREFDLLMKKNNSPGLRHVI